MSDVAEVKEALEYLTTGQGSANLAMAGLTQSDWDQLAVAVDAARRWVRLVEGLDYEAAFARWVVKKDNLRPGTFLTTANIRAIVDAAVGVEKEEL